MASRLLALLLIVFGSGFCSNVFAGEPDAAAGQGLSARVAAAHRSGISFSEVSLFKPASEGSRHPDILLHETLLLPDAARISALYQSSPEAISLTLRTEEGKTFQLEMLRSRPTVDVPNMGYIDATGRHRLPSFNAGLHYQGSIVGMERSLAALSVFANGEVMLLFADAGGNYVVGRLEDQSGRYILYNDKDMRGQQYSPCGVKDGDAPVAIPGLKGAKATSAALCNKVTLYWEIGYSVYTTKSASLVNTQNYVTGLFNQFQAMYYNERIAMQLKSMYVWTVPDDYPTNSSNAGLDKFSNYWHVLGNGFDADLAHVLVNDGNGNGGLAYVGVLCSHANGYAYSDIHGSFNTIPTFSWDVEVLTHETGHNLGSNHTHWCGWMTGSGGTCGAIDNCTTLESSSGCTTCSYTNDNAAPSTAWQGTVMSYCHLVARGINLANGFGTLPGNLIRTNVTNAACLKGLLSAKLVATPICSGDGSVSVAYLSDNLGTAPYAYTWSNGTHGQSVSGIGAAATYTLAVTDSNGCKGNYTADVITRPNPGVASKPAQVMPVCCNGARTPLTLSATVAKNLTPCESVYWLHSSFPLSTFAGAKAFLDTTAPANILPSTSTAAQTSSTGATLSIYAPSTCTGMQESYYTPVAVQTPHPTDSFVAGTTTSSSLTSGGVQIGNYASLPDQTALPTACDLIDTPSFQSLDISVSSYTGRANKMRIVIQDGSGTVIYERFGLFSGSGTFSIPTSEISGNLLQAMKVLVFDYNCTGTTCTSSQAPFRLSRRVNYDAHRPGMSVSCAAGTSVRVAFAPNSCTKLAVPATATLQQLHASLYPNPATGTVTVKFASDGQAPTTLKVTDMLGRIVYTQGAKYAGGEQQQVINTAGWARGIYFVNVGEGIAVEERLKLVLE